MEPTEDLDGLIRRLSRDVRGGAADGQPVSLSCQEARVLLEELGRLRQSNDRLRKQNRKIRTRVARAREEGSSIGLDDIES